MVVSNANYEYEFANIEHGYMFYDALMQNGMNFVMSISA